MKGNTIEFINTFQRHLPGQRIVKTSLAVMLCLLFYKLTGCEDAGRLTEAAITAIICMQPYLHDTTESGFNRLYGTVIGAVWGFLFLLSMILFPALAGNRSLVYLLIGIGTLLSLHTAVLIRRPDASGLAAIVFVCVVIAYPNVANPLEQAFCRILDVMLGTGAAILINCVRLPRAKRHNMVFFIRMTDLTENHFTRLPSSVLFRMQKLLHDGAKICLMSQHAPTFQITQLGMMKFSVPMIVMDGAAIYDPNENTYVSTTNLNPASCRWLMKRLDSLSFFIYTVHRDRNCIYHHGELTEIESAVYRRLKQSPYRYYLDDDHFSVSDVVYIKIVTTREQADRIQRELDPMLEKMKLRSVIRSQAGLEEEGCSLYFYAAHADMEHASTHLMHLLRQTNPLLERCDVADDHAYLTEMDANRLLRKVEEEYEPLLLPALLRKGYSYLQRSFNRSKPVRILRH